MSDHMNDVPVFVYTRAEAIADGVLHDVTPIAKQCGFLHPVGITNTVWTRWIEATATQVEYGQSTDARLHDLLTMLYYHIKNLPAGNRNDLLTFTARFLVNPEKNTYEQPLLWAVCSPGDTLEPVITIMLPEDY